MKLIVRLIAALPIALRSSAGAALGRLISLFPSRDRTVAGLQLKRCIGETAPSVAEVYANLARTTLESINLSPLLRNIDSYVSCNNPELVKQIADGQAGTVALSAHIGNWELLAAYAVTRQISVATIGREARNQGLQELLATIREGYGVETIWRSEKRAVRRILQFLKAGHTIAALIDQDTRVTSIHVPFFSYPAKTPSSIVKLAIQAEARIVAAFLVRTGMLQFEVRVFELDSSQGIEAVLQQYHQHLEELIREFPEQWAWVHKRWRSPREDTTMSSREYIEYLSTEAHS